MLIKRNKIYLSLIVVTFLLFTGISLFSGNSNFKYINIQNVSRYWEDRISFQHIQTPNSESAVVDDSLACLLILKDNKMYLIKDGNDDPEKVKMDSYVRNMRRELTVTSVWQNKINSKPDFITITDRRQEQMLNNTEDYVTKNFGSFYINVRNAFIKKHVDIFRSLMLNRAEAQMKVERQPIYPPAFHEVKEDLKYSTKVYAKNFRNDNYYYAEDMDGDGVTETFFVDSSDGFSWGSNSGPNVLYISNNTEEDIKSIIGKLSHESYFGTSEEEKNILETFPKDSEIIDKYNLTKVEGSSNAK